MMRSAFTSPIEGSELTRSCARIWATHSSRSARSNNSSNDRSPDFTRRLTSGAPTTIGHRQTRGFHALILRQ